MAREDDLRNTIEAATEELNGLLAAQAISERDKRESGQKEANRKIAEIIKSVYAQLKEATAIAEEFDVSFRFSPAYGMGGYYQPETARTKSSSYDDDDDEYGWVSSSSNC